MVCNRDCCWRAGDRSWGRGSDGSGSGGENGFGISASTQQLRDESSASVSTKCRGISTGQPLLRSIKFFQIGRVDHGLYL